MEYVLNFDSEISQKLDAYVDMCLKGRHGKSKIDERQVNERVTSALELIKYIMVRNCIALVFLDGCHTLLTAVLCSG